MNQLLNLHQLRIFTCVAQQKGFSKAATSLRMSQPAVSIQVKNLEDALGVTLFDRIGHDVYLTTEGHAVLMYAKRMFDLLGSLEADLANIKGLQTGKLLVGSCKVCSAYILPVAIASFKRKYPGVEIILRVAQSDQVEQWVLENEVDLGVIIGDPLSPNIIKQTFREEKLVLVLPPQHPLIRKSTVSLQEISKEVFLFPYTGRLASLIEGAFAATGVSITRKMVLGHTDALKTAITVGLGVSIMAQSSVQRDVMLGAVVTRKIGIPNFRCTLNVIYHKDKHFSLVGRAFFGFLRKPLSANKDETLTCQ